MFFKSNKFKSCSEDTKFSKFSERIQADRFVTGAGSARHQNGGQDQDTGRADSLAVHGHDSIPAVQGATDTARGQPASRLLHCADEQVRGRVLDAGDVSRREGRACCASQGARGSDQDRQGREDRGPDQLLGRVCQAWPEHVRSEGVSYSEGARAKDEGQRQSEQANRLTCQIRIRKQTWPYIYTYSKINNMALTR